MTRNAEVAERLNEVADLLDVLGERFKPEAYRRAARSIEGLAEPVEAVALRGGLREIPGVGEAIDEKVQELLRTGSLAYLEKLRAEVPAGLRELMRLPGLGPKTVRRFWTEFSIDGPAGLAQAIATGALAGQKGFGEKKIAQLAGVLDRAPSEAPAGRLPLEQAYPVARALLAALRASTAAKDVAVAGSFRRGRESVGDLDLLVTSDEPERIFEVFSHLPEVREVRLRGPTKETVVLRAGLQADLRVVEPAAFGAALQYFTGSKDHNVRLRSLARDRGLKVNEYGVFRGEERVGGRTEEEVYRLLELPWIPPELREDRGEIPLAQSGRLPKLVEPDDLRGDLHLHLAEPYGPGELARLVDRARARRLSYVGVVIAGVAEDGEPWAAPATTREELAARSDPKLRLLAVEEVAGSAAASPRTGRGVDYRIALPDNGEPPKRTPVGPPVRLVAHGARPSEGGPDRLLAWARSLSAAVEVGPGYDRADSIRARAAKEAGVTLAVPTGVGAPDGEPLAEVALAYARRAGAERKDVANAGELTSASEAPRRRRR